MRARKPDFLSISRLKCQTAFDSLRQSKSRWVAPSMVVQTSPDSDLAGRIGLGVSASKRTAPRAVDRNRMRRRLKAAALVVLPELAIPGQNYLVSARAGAATRKMEEIEADLRWCLRKLSAADPGKTP